MFGVFPNSRQPGPAEGVAARGRGWNGTIFKVASNPIITGLCKNNARVLLFPLSAENEPAHSFLRKGGGLRFKSHLFPSCHCLARDGHGACSVHQSQELPPWVSLGCVEQPLNPVLSSPGPAVIPHCLPNPVGVTVNNPKQPLSNVLRVLNLRWRSTGVATAQTQEKNKPPGWPRGCRHSKDCRISHRNH